MEPLHSLCHRIYKSVFLVKLLGDKISETEFLPQLTPLGCPGESGATAASRAGMGTGIGGEDAQVAQAHQYHVQPASRSKLKLLNFLAAPAFHGQHCSGSTTETEHCNTDPCPGEGCQLCLANVLSLPSLSSFFLFLSCHLSCHVILETICCPPSDPCPGEGYQLCFANVLSLPAILPSISCCVTFSLARHSCHNLLSSQ